MVAKQQKAERHSQETEPTQQHTPAQNTAEAEKAPQEHKPTGTETSNHPQRNPEQARPPKATSAGTKRKPVPVTQDRETSRTRARATRPVTPRRWSLPSSSKGAHGLPAQSEEGGRATGHCNARGQGGARWKGMMLCSSCTARASISRNLAHHTGR
jgi:hypothetical protein